MKKVTLVMFVVLGIFLLATPGRNEIPSEPANVVIAASAYEVRETVTSDSALTWHELNHAVGIEERDLSPSQWKTSVAEAHGRILAVMRKRGYRLITATGNPGSTLLYFGRMESQ